MKISIIFPAAGKSSRFSQNEKKQFIDLDGRPVWLRKVELFCNREDVCQMILVINPEDRDMILRRYQANLAFLEVQLIDGGEERCDSVQRALKAIRNDATHIAIHDIVRPCVETKHIDSVFQNANEFGGALLATPLVHTLKRADSARNIEVTVPRKNLWLAQTPQVFKKEWLVEAYEKRIPGFNPTDDAEMVESIGHPVRLVECGLSNLKITTSEDLELAKSILKSRSKPIEPRFHPFCED